MFDKEEDWDRESSRTDSTIYGQRKEFNYYEFQKAP